MIAPSLLASFVYVFVFTLWTLYISLSNSTLLPTYQFVGLKPYFDLWSNQRWKIAYGNLFFFSAFYVVLALVVGLALAIAIDQRVRGEAVWRTIFLYPLAVSFVVTGTVWSWLYSPDAGIEFLVRSLGWTRFHLPPDDQPRHRDLRDHRDRHLAVVGLCHGAVSRRPALGRSRPRQGGADRRRRPMPHLPQGDPAVDRADLHRGRRRSAAVRHQDLRPRRRADAGGPGISTTFPAIYVYDLMFQRGQIAIGAAAAIMMLLALAVVLVPYALWTVWRSRREAAHG